MQQERLHLRNAAPVKVVGSDRGMKTAGYFAIAALLILIGWAYFGLNGALITAGVLFIIGAFFVLQTKSLVHFYVEAAPALARVLR